MSETRHDEARRMTLEAVQAVATDLAGGERADIDLTDLEHDQARHADLMPLSVLAWWLLSTTADASSWTCRMPATNSAAFRHIARSGLLTAADHRSVAIVGPDGSPVDPLHPASRDQARLPGVDWEVMDELIATGERLRIIPDLADPRRAPNLPRPQRRMVYPWLANLGLSSPAIAPLDYQLFMSDADLVLAELIDNVHRWSVAARAFTAVSTTRGSAGNSMGRSNWNRLHIVVADAGVGIPTALRRDLEALAAVHRADGCFVPLSDRTDADIVEILMRYAFGRRPLANHNGHGLNVAQVSAGRWVGTLDIVTVGTNKQSFLRSSSGVNPARFDAEDDLALPHAHGTLIHIVLQAADASHRADAERDMPRDGSRTRSAAVAGAHAAA